jgi:hypothetical protein
LRPNRRLNPRDGTPKACVVIRAESSGRPESPKPIVGSATWGFPVATSTGADHGGAAEAGAAVINAASRAAAKARRGWDMHPPWHAERRIRFHQGVEAPPPGANDSARADRSA